MQINQERRESKEARKERRHRRVERRERKEELTASWKKISRAWAIGSTEAMRKVGR